MVVEEAIPEQETENDEEDGKCSQIETKERRDPPLARGRAQNARDDEKKGDDEREELVCQDCKRAGFYGCVG